MYRTLMRPSNALCDIMGLTDEHERGMVRMFVNMLALTIVGVIVLTLFIGAPVGTR